MLAKKLEEIGLNEKEARVYIAVLELGQGSASDIAKKSGVNRATTYFTLENLMKAGLVSASNEGKKQMFIPEDPAQIENIIIKQQRELEQKKRGLKNVVNELNTINSASVKKPIVKYYLGKEGIIRMASTSFDEVENEEMWLAFSKEERDKLISENENAKLIQKRIGRSVKSNVIYNSDSETLESNKTSLRIKINNKKYPLPADIAVFGDKIRLTSFRDQIGIIIENKDIAKTLKSVFKLAIESAQNKNP